MSLLSGQDVERENLAREYGEEATACDATELCSLCSSHIQASCNLHHLEWHELCILWYLF